ncbi:MAG: GIY-YIG nuclease family protein [Chloroflexi bacterium]|nr:GIY-YIG nuclease family protein [Chloroflexota bacterium]
MTGIVYCLENPAMPDLVKIGITQDIEQRIRSLDNTSVPLPFVCFVAVEVDDANETEQLLHDVFSDHRVRSNREFFEVSPERVAAALRLTGGRDVTPTTDVVDDQEAQAALNKARKKRARFNFGMVGIEAGAELQFHYRGILNDGQPFTAEVVSRTTILFEGQETSLSAAASTIMQRHGVTWTAKWSPSGPLHWYYEGESLDELRRAMENEGGDE